MRLIATYDITILDAETAIQNPTAGHIYHRVFTPKFFCGKRELSQQKYGRYREFRKKEMLEDGDFIIAPEGITRLRFGLNWNSPLEFDRETPIQIESPPENIKVKRENSRAFSVYFPGGGNKNPVSFKYSLIYTNPNKADFRLVHDPIIRNGDVPGINVP